MRKYMKYYIFILFLLFNSSNAWAEYCWKVGCTGNIGYIRIPAGQLDSEKSKTISIKNMIYNIDHQTLLFSNPGLPKVNEIVILNNESSMLNTRDDSEVYKYIKYHNMKAIDYELDNKFKIAKLHTYWHDFGGNLMRKGSIIKILEYKTFKIDNQDVLFALVEIVED